MNKEEKKVHEKVNKKNLKEHQNQIKRLVVMRRILTLICLLVINFSFSQIKFEAEVSKNNLGVNENLRVDFKMNKDGEGISIHLHLIIGCRRTKPVC